MDAKVKAAIEGLKERVKKHREAYSLDIFVNSEALTASSSIDSISANMGRHMCDCFVRYIDEALAAFEAGRGEG